MEGAPSDGRPYSNSFFRMSDATSREPASERWMPERDPEPAAWKTSGRNEGMAQVIRGFGRIRYSVLVLELRLTVGRFCCANTAPAWWQLRGDQQTGPPGSSSHYLGGLL